MNGQTGAISRQHKARILRSVIIPDLLEVCLSPALAEHKRAILKCVRGALGD